MRTFAAQLICLLLCSYTATAAKRELKQDKDDGSPSAAPSLVPTPFPSSAPSDLPTLTPSVAPSLSFKPTTSNVPSLAPTLKSSVSPTSGPSQSPEKAPSGQPSIQASGVPSSLPSMALSNRPSASTASPSIALTGEPSATPSSAPSIAPTTSVPSSSPTDEFVGVALPEIMVRFSVYGGPVSLDDLAIQLQRFIEDTVQHQSAVLGELSHVTIYATVRREYGRLLRALQAPFVPVARVISRVEGTVYFRNQPFVPKTEELSELLVEYFSNWGDKDLERVLTTDFYRSDNLTISVAAEEVEGATGGSMGEVVDDDSSASPPSALLLGALGVGVLALFVAVLLVIWQRHKDKPADTKSTGRFVASLGSTDEVDSGGSGNSSEGAVDVPAKYVDGPKYVVDKSDDESSTATINLENNKNLFMSPVDLDAYPDEMPQPTVGYGGYDDILDEMSFAGVTVGGAGSVYTSNTMITEDVFTLADVYSVDAPTPEHYDAARLEEVISSANQFVEENSAEHSDNESGSTATPEQHQDDRLRTFIPGTSLLVGANSEFDDEFDDEVGAIGDGLNEEDTLAGYSTKTPEHYDISRLDNLISSTQLLDSAQTNEVDAEDTTTNLILL